MKISKYETRIDENNNLYMKESGTFNIDGRRVYNSPDMLADFFGNVIGIKQAAEEHVYIACLDTKFHIVACFEASHGSVNASMVPIREILQKSLLLSAVNIAMAHNHPTGDITPSQNDIDCTSRLKKACEICGIGFTDHVIVGSNNNDYFSFYNNGCLTE